MLLSGLMYILVSAMSWTYAIAIPIIVAHSAGGANWVFSTVMLQERTKDRFRGRVFSTEWLLIMSAHSISILTASLVLESSVLILRQAFLLFAFLQVLTGLFWLILVVPRERKSEKQSHSASNT